jgi:hypothetical protein
MPSRQWPTGQLMIKSLLIQRRNIILPPQVLPMAIVTFIILSGSTMEALRLPKTLGDIRVTPRTTLVGYPAKADMATVTFVFVVQVSVWSR